MCPFVETLRIEQGKACHLSYHNRRMNATRQHFWPGCPQLSIEDSLTLSPDMDGLKCRVVYDESGIREVTYTPYRLRPVRSLHLVQDDDIDYTYKSTDREALNRLFALRGEQDDVLIVRHGLLTDTSIANVALFDGVTWYTPRTPLLKGTRRASLIDDGTIRERDLHVASLSGFERIRLFNALIGWGEIELPVTSLFA